MEVRPMSLPEEPRTSKVVWVKGEVVVVMVGVMAASIRSPMATFGQEEPCYLKKVDISLHNSRHITGSQKRRSSFVYTRSLSHQGRSSLHWRSATEGFGGTLWRYILLRTSRTPDDSSPLPPPLLLLVASLPKSLLDLFVGLSL